MWTDTTRAQYARAALALPSDLTDDEWALLEPFFPPASHVGRPRKWPMRRGRVRQGGVISAVAVGHRQAALAVMCRG